MIVWSSLKSYIRMVCVIIMIYFKVAEVSTASLGRFNEVPNKTKGVKSGKVKKSQKSGKKNKPGKKIGQLKESASKTNRKPKAGKGNRNFRTKLGGRKRRT